MIVRSIDIETTGIPTETDKHAIVEIGWTDITREGDGEWRVGYPKSILCNPGRPIPPEASAIHHIRDVHVKDALSPDQALLKMAEAQPADAYVAHNMEFEQTHFGGGGKPMICSFKAALRVFRESPEHGNQTLRYFLNLDDQDDFEPAMAEPPHRAGPDSYVTAHIAALLLDATDFDTLVAWSKMPALLIKCWMNKHRNKLWSDVARDDPSYLDWIVNRSDITDRNIRATAKYWIKRMELERAEAAKQPASDGEVKL
jgi:exodeoxyribonuclease X